MTRPRVVSDRFLGIVGGSKIRLWSPYASRFAGAAGRPKKQMAHRESAGRRKLKRFGLGARLGEDSSHRIVGKLTVVLLYVDVGGSGVRVRQEARYRADALGPLVYTHRGGMADRVAVNHTFV